jgi:hypothetical protein
MWNAVDGDATTQKVYANLDASRALQSCLLLARD